MIYDHQIPHGVVLGDIKNYTSINCSNILSLQYNYYTCYVCTLVHQYNQFLKQINVHDLSTLSVKLHSHIRIVIINNQRSECGQGWMYSWWQPSGADPGFSERGSGVQSPEATEYFIT